MRKIKTWPALLEQVTSHQRRLLIESSKKFAQITSDKKISVAISGISLLLSHEEAGTVLCAQLLKEQEEELSIHKKYNALGLEREAIIKTVFFKEILRKTDLAKEFFTFSEFRDGRVKADLQNLCKSVQYHNRIRDLEVYVGGAESMENFTKKRARELVVAIRDQMVEDLWPQRTDKIFSAGARWIFVDLPAAPERTKLRLIEWAKRGITPKVICHKAGVFPYFRGAHFRDLFDMLQTRNRCFKELGEDTKRLEEFIDELENQTMGENGQLISEDPILFIEDGEWTIVIDQYSSFRKEKEVIETVKEHYNLLRQRYGIMNLKN